MDQAEQILTLIQPFVDEGKILLREKEEIEKNINNYVLIYKNNELLACAGLKDCKEGHTGEIYSLAVKKDKQNTGLSTKLLDKIIEKAKTEGFVKVFALTKFGTEWFVKNGFAQMQIKDLPKKRQALFNHKRNSSIFFKDVN